MQTCGFLIMKKSINISRRKRAERATCFFLIHILQHSATSVSHSLSADHLMTRLKSVRAPAVKFDNIIIKAVSIREFCTLPQTERCYYLIHGTQGETKKGLRHQRNLCVSDYTRSPLHTRKSSWAAPFGHAACRFYSLRSRGAKVQNPDAKQSCREKFTSHISIFDWVTAITQNQFFVLFLYYYPMFYTVLDSSSYFSA